MDQTIWELRRRLDQALPAGDAGVLDESVSDDCRIIGPKGYFIPKAGAAKSPLTRIDGGSLDVTGR
jgi:hypothetical protein